MLRSAGRLKHLVIPGVPRCRLGQIFGAGCECVGLVRSGGAGRQQQHCGRSHISKALGAADQVGGRNGPRLFGYQGEE